jgi:hypothetical protein
VHNLLRLVNAVAKAITPACCCLARLFDWSSWVAISNLSPIFSFMGGVGKRINN